MSICSCISGKDKESRGCFLVFYGALLSRLFFFAFLIKAPFRLLAPWLSGRVPRQQLESFIGWFNCCPGTGPSALACLPCAALLRGAGSPPAVAAGPPPPKQRRLMAAQGCRCCPSRTLTLWLSSFNVIGCPLRLRQLFSSAIVTGSLTAVLIAVFDLFVGCLVKACAPKRDTDRNKKPPHT